MYQLFLIPDCSTYFFKYLLGKKKKKKNLSECFKFSVGRLCGELLFLSNNFQDLYQFVWNNWKQPKTFMSKWKKSKGMSHLQQSLGLKWLSLKGYKNTRSSLLYPSYQKKKKNRKRIIGHNATESQSNQIPLKKKKKKNTQQEWSSASYLCHWIRTVRRGSHSHKSSSC